MNFADESSLPLLIVMLPLVGALTVLALIPFRSLLVKRLSYYMGALFVGLTFILAIFSFVFLLKTDGSIVYRFSYLLIVQLSLNPLSFTLIILTLF
ncbi:MAG: hypothetical protein Q8M92_07940, partial [Candidatus Subteraquimicrobiales bacterium]|nr:hypothetical protein [Candidatus Subteraquimicrobiales bacterium]